MDLQIEGKVFMVAASSKGLGFGIARELAKTGQQFVLPVVPKPKSKKLLKTYEMKQGQRFTHRFLMPPTPNQ
jgi:NAD(P)-dependent dehydrogenase (short-subunit alcohol dehydrogenase family)